MMYRGGGVVCRLSTWSRLFFPVVVPMTGLFCRMLMKWIVTFSNFWKIKVRYVPGIRRVYYKHSDSGANCTVEDKIDIPFVIMLNLHFMVFCDVIDDIKLGKPPG